MKGRHNVVVHLNEDASCSLFICGVIGIDVAAILPDDEPIARDILYGIHELVIVVNRDDILYLMPAA